MSLAGFKKQINKANQFMSEKIGGAKGTELDDEFVDMERKTDAMCRLVDELMARTHELLQPNPASRAKLSASKSISKLRGTANHTLYPQPEGLLGECMIRYGKELGEEAPFGQALSEAGESYKQLAEVKYSMEDSVKQNFIEPLLQLQNKDLKEVNFHRKKLVSRRLDYDCKKRKDKDAPAVEEDIRSAEEKFEESKLLAESAMHNLLDNDTEQVLQLSAFIEAELAYHQQSAEILSALMDSLNRKCSEASSRPRKEHIPKRVTSFSSNDKSPVSEVDDSGYGGLHVSSPNFYASTSPNVASFRGTTSMKPPCCEALYDFEAENAGELGFKEGNTIQLVARVDENWLEGSLHGQMGFFPCNYVKIIVDLPLD